MSTPLTLLLMLYFSARADTGDTGVSVDTGSADTGAPVDFVDNDCDGIHDSDDPFVDLDVDTDGDGLSNLLEVTTCDSDPCVANDDVDGDGISNTDEINADTDPCNAGDPDQTRDEDCDTIPDYRDEFIGFEADLDNDGDGVLNGDELGACGSDPCVPNIDPDGDGVPTETELICGTDPCDLDSDNDGLWDGDEFAANDECGENPDGEQSGDPDTVLDPPSDRYGLSGGSFTGGGCHTVPAAAAWLPLLLGLGLVLTRRQGVSLLLLMIVFPARAQEMDAQRFRPAVDGRHFVIVDDALVGPDGPGGHILLNHANQPFMYRFPPGRQTDVPILNQVWTMDLLAHWNIKRVMVGVAAPLHLASAGLHLDKVGPHVLGDIDIDAKVAILDTAHHPLGLAISTRLGLPTGNGQAWLGHPGLTSTGQVDLSYGKKLILAANLGLHFAKPMYFQDVKWGSSALWRAGLHVPVNPILWLSTEIDANHQLGEQRGVGSNPVEGLISSRLFPWRSFVATLGGGAGLSRGIGAPAYRFFLGIGWLPKATPPSPKQDSPKRPASHAEQPATNTNDRIQVTDNQIHIQEKIFFDMGSAQIGAGSHGLLDELVVVVLDHPELTLIEIQGHTDDQGEASGNQALSQARAEAVMLYMVQHSVDAQRVIARGFGETRPLDKSDTDAARATNRRVELHIIERR